MFGMTSLATYSMFTWLPRWFVEAGATPQAAGNLLGVYSGVALLPTITEGGERSSALGGFDWGIMSTTKHPDEAFRALEYFAAQDHRMGHG